MGGAGRLEGSTVTTGDSVVAVGVSSVRSGTSLGSRPIGKSVIGGLVGRTGPVVNTGSIVGGGAGPTVAPRPGCRALSSSNYSVYVYAR